MLRAVRIGAGILILLVGAATLAYGAYVSLKTGQADYATGFFCGLAAMILFAVGSLPLDPASAMCTAGRGRGFHLPRPRGGRTRP